MGMVEIKIPFISKVSKNITFSSFYSTTRKLVG